MTEQTTVNLSEQGLQSLARTVEEGITPASLVESTHIRHVKQMDIDERIFEFDIPRFDRIMIHLKKRMLFAEELCPILICSLGGHIADIHQADSNDIPGAHDNPFYFFKGSPEVMNIPIVLVSPAGLSKSFVMSVFFRRNTGICPIRSKFSGKITEAGFIGMQGAGEEIHMGDAYNYRDGFLLFNEISNLLLSQDSSHSAELVNQVMEALSERFVTKRTGAMDLQYPTSVTIWGGIQPMRFNMAQGLGRRLVPVTKAWTPQDVELFKIEREQEKITGKGSFSVNMKEVNQIRKEVAELFHHICVEKVEWNKSMYTYLKSKALGHLDQNMMERILIGKEIINNGTEKVIRIEKNDENKKLIDLFATNSKIVAEGGDISLLLSTLHGKTWKTNDLWLHFRRFGYSYSHFRELLTTCTNLGLVSKVFDVLNGGWIYQKAEDKKPTVLSVLEE